MGAGRHGQILASLPHGMQERIGGAPAPAPLGRPLHDPDAVLLGPVEVVIACDPQRLTRGDKAVGELARPARVAHVQRAALTVVLIV